MMKNDAPLPAAMLQKAQCNAFRPIWPFSPNRKTPMYKHESEILAPLRCLSHSLGAVFLSFLVCRNGRLSLLYCLIFRDVFFA
jgi:hypothetical protein